MSCPACAANVELEQLLAQRDDTISRQRTVIGSLRGQLLAQRDDTISRQRTVIGSLRGQLAAARADAAEWARVAEVLGTRVGVRKLGERDEFVLRVAVSGLLVRGHRAGHAQLAANIAFDAGEKLMRAFAR